MEAITQGMGDKYGLLETKVFPPVMVHLFRSCAFSIRPRLEEESVKGCNQHSIRVFYISMVMRIPGNVSAMVGEKIRRRQKNNGEEKDRVIYRDDYNSQKYEKLPRTVVPVVPVVPVLHGAVFVPALTHPHRLSKFLLIKWLKESGVLEQIKQHYMLHWCMKS